MSTSSPSTTPSATPPSSPSRRPQRHSVRTRPSLLNAAATASPTVSLLPSSTVSQRSTPGPPKDYFAAPSPSPAVPPPPPDFAAVAAANAAKREGKEKARRLRIRADPGIGWREMHEVLRLEGKFLGGKTLVIKGRRLLEDHNLDVEDRNGKVTNRKVALFTDVLILGRRLDDSRRSFHFKSLYAQRIISLSVLSVQLVGDAIRLSTPKDTLHLRPPTPSAARALATSLKSAIAERALALASDSSSSFTAPSTRPRASHPPPPQTPKYHTRTGSLPPPQRPVSPPAPFAGGGGGSGGGGYSAFTFDNSFMAALGLSSTSPSASTPSPMPPRDADSLKQRISHPIPMPAHSPLPPPPSSSYTASSADAEEQVEYLSAPRGGGGGTLGSRPGLPSEFRLAGASAGMARRGSLASASGSSVGAGGGGGGGASSHAGYAPSNTSSFQSDFDGPCWVDDAAASACQECDAKFSFMVRKHHCRICGRVICFRCSHFRPSLYGASRPMRACTACVRAMENPDEDEGSDEDGEGEEGEGTEELTETETEGTVVGAGGGAG